MHIDIQPFAEYAVAPYVGAWIETLHQFGLLSGDTVAPYVGAWIETLVIERVSTEITVAPYVGAWIETFNTAISNEANRCRTLRGCVD